MNVCRIHVSLLCAFLAGCGEADCRYATYNEGKRLHEAEDFAGAEVLYTRAIEEHPDHGSAWAARAMCRDILKRPAEARSDVEQVIKLGRRGKATREALGCAHWVLAQIAWGERRWEDVVRECKTSLDYDVDEGRAYYLKGSAHLWIGTDKFKSYFGGREDFEQAAACFREYKGLCRRAAQNVEDLIAGCDRFAAASR